MAVGQNPGTPVNTQKAFKKDYFVRWLSQPQKGTEEVLTHSHTRFQSKLVGSFQKASHLFAPTGAFSVPGADDLVNIQKAPN